MTRHYQNLHRLSPRQTDIINLFADGKTTDEICNAMNITRNTLRSYLHNIYMILEVKGRTAAINEWNRRRKEALNNAD